MLDLASGALRRIGAWLLGLAFLTILAVGALAHEGHDHGVPPPPVAAGTANARVTAQSEAYELVGILRGEELSLYLDRYATNEPVTDATIAVTIGGDEDVRAEPTSDGAYRVSSRKFSNEGPLELIFAVTAPAGDDLLIGMLPLPIKAAATPSSSPASPLPDLQSLLSNRIGDFTIGTPYLVAALALVLGILIGLGARSRSRVGPAAGLAVLVLIASTALALSHEGHDHGAEAAKGALPSGDAPRRLPDGTVFMPKTSQRLLNVRTTVTKPEEAQKAVSLVGRVIADPNRSGIVQSITGGRIIAPEGGLPHLGRSVRKGDVLALVEQAVPQADRTTISERIGEIEQDIAVAETKLRRIRALAEKAIAPQSQVVDAETELEGLKRRREIVRQTRVEPEILRAPIDGTLAAARVVAGQVVGPQDVIFQIVDPNGFWVEALVYGEVDPAKVTGASAAAADGTPLSLAFQGFSRALQQQATVIQFAVEAPPANLAVGQPVTVIARNGAAVSGIMVPRDAVVRGANGAAMVWRHTEPERFEAQPVRTEPFDATRLVIRAGVGPGERIVVRGAELINQVR